MTPDQIAGLLIVLASVVVIALFPTRPKCRCGRKLRHVGAITSDLCAVCWWETFK